jgi:hypothetical protein
LQADKSFLQYSTAYGLPVLLCLLIASTFFIKVCKYICYQLLFFHHLLLRRTLVQQQFYSS